MVLKRPERVGTWRFDLESPTGEPFSITAGTKHKVLDQVRAQIDRFDVDHPGYSAKGRAEAASLGLDFYDYLETILQQQHCQRLGGMASGHCWSSGLGDQIHEFSHRFDQVVERAPAPIRIASRAVVKAVTYLTGGEATPRLSGCRGCGGRKLYSPEGNSLGRVAKVNKIFPKK